MTSETKVPMPKDELLSFGHSTPTLLAYGDARASERDAFWMAKVAELTISDVYTLIGHANTIDGIDMPLYFHELAAKIARVIGDHGLSNRCDELRATLTNPRAGETA